MRIVTRAKRVRHAVQTILRKLPDRDRLQVCEIVGLIRGVREWRFKPLTDEIDRNSSEFRPLVILGGNWVDTEDGRVVHRPSCAEVGQIVYCLPIIRLFSDEALLGITAHEFGHAFRAASLGPNWELEMRRDRLAEEDIADQTTIAWGFGRQLRRLMKEREETVDPEIKRREHAIRRLILRRDAQLPEEQPE